MLQCIVVWCSLAGFVLQGTQKAAQNETSTGLILAAVLSLVEGREDNGSVGVIEQEGAAP